MKSDPYNHYDQKLVSNFAVANSNVPGKVQMDAVPPRKNYSREDRALVAAVINGDANKFHALLLAGRNSEEGYKKALFFAVGYNRSNFFISLERRLGSAARTEMFSGLLLLAVLNQDPVHIAACISKGADVKAHDHECLKQAFIGENPRVITLIAKEDRAISSLIDDPVFMAKYHDFNGKTKARFKALFAGLDTQDIRLEL